MKQTIKPYTANSEQELSLNNIKGKTTIQLFDTDGKVVYSKTDSNMVTNAVSDIINSGSFYQMMSTESAQAKIKIVSNNIPLSKNMFGGLLLFKNEISEDATKYMLPRNSICVGAAGNITSSDVDRGSFNPTESEQTENGYKFVWDFTTSQCNSDISAIALTSILGGNSFAPNGITTSSETLTNFSTYAQSSLTRHINPNTEITGISSSNLTDANAALPFYISPVVGESRYIVLADKNNMKIVAYRLSTNLVKRISDTSAATRLMSPSALQLDLSTLSPAPMSGVKTFGITVDGEGFYLMYPTAAKQFAMKHYIWNNTEIPTDFDTENPPKVFDEDTADGASAVIATTFDLYVPTSNTHNSFGAYDSESGNYYVADANAIVHLVDGTTGNELATAYSNFTFNGDIVISTCGSLYWCVHYKSSTSSSDTSYISSNFIVGTELSSDATTTNIRIKGIYFNEPRVYVSTSTRYHRGTLCSCYISDGVSDKGRVSKIALNLTSNDTLGYYITVVTPSTYLATINNITPVTKTNATSMKVIYEIHDTSDDETEAAPEM